MEYVFLAFFVINVVLYLLDRKGWHATAKRVTRIVRANIESAKPLKALEQRSDKAEKDKWTAEFEGKALVEGKAAPKHEISRTWYANYGGSVHPFWQCKCGTKDWHLDKDMAGRKAKEHVKDFNEAERLLSLNGGTHAW